MTTDMTAGPATTRADWTSDQEPRWCPGCGDYSILSAMQLLMPQFGVRPENTVFVSGIGCAARFPYYHEHLRDARHPRARPGSGPPGWPPAGPIWTCGVVGGDGDILSIGGNHLLHSLRRNINIKILLFNNQIYGLTKGQYSPTSEIGKVTKSTPFGSVDEPLNPLSVALGAEATFVARTHDLDRNHMQEMFRRAWEHTGAAFVEVYQNCNVFNDGAFADITKKDRRASMLISLQHGEPIRFGADHERGVMMSRTGELQIVEVAEAGEENLLIHDERADTPSLAFALSRLSSGPFMPTPIGVFRAAEGPEYASQVSRQLAFAQERSGPGRPARPAPLPRHLGRRLTRGRPRIPRHSGGRPECQFAATPPRRRRVVAARPPDPPPYRGLDGPRVS